MYTQEEKDKMAMKNSTIDKFAARGDGDDPKIPFVESKNKTYTEVTYTKNPSYSDKDSEMGCGTSIQVPGCDKNGNKGKFRNYNTRLKQIKNDTKINRPYQELRQLTPSSNTNKKNKR